MCDIKFKVPIPAATFLPLLKIKVEFRGGDKPDDKLKPFDDEHVVGFSEGLKDLVSAISIVHFRGKVPKDFDAVEGSTRAT